RSDRPSSTAPGRDSPTRPPAARDPPGTGRPTGRRTGSPGGAWRPPCGWGRGVFAPGYCTTPDRSVAGAEGAVDFAPTISYTIGIPRSVALAVSAQVTKKTGLKRDRLMLTCSHTHCGPAISDNLTDMYLMPESEAKKIDPYTKQLEGWMVEVVVKSLDALKPAT